MSRRDLPYIVDCGFCEQGLLRFARCRACGAIVAMCDECELVWTDIAAVQANPSMKSTGAFPACPRCADPDTVSADKTAADWTQLDRSEVERAGLTRYMADESP